MFAFSEALAAALIEILEGFRVEREAAGGQALAHFVQVAAEEVEIVHCSRRVFRWAPRLAVWQAGVIGAGADQAIVAVLLENVGGPAGHAAYGEDGGEEINRNAERIVTGGRVEINIGVQALRFVNGLFDAAGLFVKSACPVLLPSCSLRALR